MSSNNQDYQQKQQMFCCQCEQTAKGYACTTMGICGKTPSVAALHDLLVYILKGLACVAIRVREVDMDTRYTDQLIYDGLFATITNVDFDEERLATLIKKIGQQRDELVQNLINKQQNINDLHSAVIFKLGNTVPSMIEQGHVFGLMDKLEKNQDIQSLKNTLLYGIKGIAAYADHAAILGESDITISSFLQKALANMLRYDLNLHDWLALLLECGQVNLRTMELLDKAHTTHYGHPVPTAVSLGVKPGKAILVSGHDLHDLELLLQQTVGTGITVYTHGEMLPAHGYPELKKYPHLHGHYGTAWQNQHAEFAAFPGAILMTTNCIQKPLDSYQDRIFTTGLVAWPKIVHIAEEQNQHENSSRSYKNFAPVIRMALALPGFVTTDAMPKAITVGFARNAVLSVADKVIALVKGGKIRHFFLVAGCDGAKPGRNYYTEFVEKVPQDCVVLTLACGKFRFLDKELGDIDGIPRLLDIGQCNDAYSAIQIAIALAGVFNCGVNELPLSLILSWYEQKAVAILLTLLSLGIKNIRLGPTLPAFITPNVLNILVEKFNLRPITDATKDLQEILS